MWSVFNTVIFLPIIIKISSLFNSVRVTVNETRNNTKLTEAKLTQWERMEKRIHREKWMKKNHRDRTDRQKGFERKVNTQGKPRANIRGKPRGRS